jgi:hypothetical protein
VPGNVPENPVVGGRRPPLIVVRHQPVHGNDQVQIRKFRSFCRDGEHPA